MINSEYELVIYNRNIVINTVALIMIGCMAIWAATNKHKAREMGMFLRMCILTSISTLCDIAYYIWMDRKEVTGSTASILIGWVIVDVCILLLVRQWLIFVEYSLHQSNDVIKRDYKFIMIPFWIAVVFVALSHFFYIDAIFDRMPEWFITIYHGIGWYLVVSLTWIARGICIFYFIFAYYLVVKEKKRVKIPNYIVITPTVVCFVLGIFINRDYLNRVQGLYYTIGLFLIWFFMFRRFIYIDPETGFFIEKYLKVLYSYYGNNGDKGCTIISFKATSDPVKMANILKDWIPEDSKTLRIGDSKFLVVSEALKPSMVKRYTSLISENAAEEGIEVETGFATRGDESVREFFERMI